MRGADVMQELLFTLKRLEDFVPQADPLRDIRELLNTALRQMDADFNTMYADRGRYSIAPRNCCAPWYCKPSTAFALSDNCASTSNTTCSTAGLLASAWTMRYGIIPASPPTATG